MRNLSCYYVTALSCAIFLVVGACMAEECTPLSSGVRGRIAMYAAEHYELAPDIRVEGGETVSNSSFRRVTVQAVAPKRSIELFLSPDQRFLAESILDTTLDPSVERRRVARATQAALLAEGSASLGPEDAAVTVIEFSDFQCPFCKRAADALAQMPESEREGVRFVFKHRPLPMHRWARRAALASICASFQGGGAFWDLERFLFANQDSLTLETLDATIRDFASNDQRISAKLLDGCLASKETEALLLRDEKLAELYHVDAAPTMFINGTRKVGFNTPAELWSAIRVAALDIEGGRHDNGSGER